MCQCRRKNCGQLDIFPTRDAYHPMSEYPTYHTHGRYVAPGSTKRSPYEEVRVGPTGGERQRLWLGRGSEGVLGKPKELKS